MDSMSGNNQAHPSKFHRHGLQLRPGEASEGVEKCTPKKRTKVKTGCYTCKQRRVKCDEARPWCQRCVKFGVDCDGYPALSGPPRTSKVILPRSKRPIPLLATRPVYPIHSGPRFEDAKEGLCFRIYCEEMATQIKGPLKTSLWNQLIPQISEVEPFIRHAIVALGAMRKITQDSEDIHGKMTHFRPTNAPDFPYALRQYDRALQGMRKTIADGRKDLQKAMIACILVFCFETMTNKPNNAVMNAESGLMLLQSWMRANGSEHTGYNWCRESNEYRVDGDLMAAYANLDLQVLFFRDSRPRRVHEFVIRSANESIAMMPNEFTTLKTAHSFWMLIMRRNYHFIVMVLGEGKAAEMCGPFMHGEAPWEDCVNIFPGGNIFSTPKEPPFELFPDCLQFCEDIARWIQACGTLFEFIRSTGTEEEQVLVTLLQMHSIMGPIMLKSAFITEQTTYDQYLPEFRTILQLIEWVKPRMTASGGGRSTYHFDLGFIVGLFLVGARCRDPVVRNKSIEMLLDGHAREGFWDTAGSATFIIWNRDLDEEGRDEYGEIPEHKRWFITSAYVDMDERKALMGATRKGLEGLNFQHKEFRW